LGPKAQVFEKRSREADEAERAYGGRGALEKTSSLVLRFGVRELPPSLALGKGKAGAKKRV